MSAFTKEQLAIIEQSSITELVYPEFRAWVSDLAAFALAQMERAENAEATVADLLGSVKRIAAERDRLKNELDLLTIAVYDAYGVLKDGSVYAIETDADAFVSWPNLENGSEIVDAIRRACARRKKKGES